MANIQKLWSSYINLGNQGSQTSPDTYIGDAGRIWYDTINNVFRVSDGTTAGGTIIGSGGGGGSNISNGTSYVSIPAASGNVVVSVDGTLSTFSTTGALTLEGGVINGAGAIGMYSQDGGPVFIEASNANYPGDWGGNLSANAGSGYDADNTNVGTEGGRVSIRAGYGGNANVSDAGIGGTVDIIAGAGGGNDYANNVPAGPGGDLNLMAGNAGGINTNLLGNRGGAVYIAAGESNQTAMPGGDVYIQAGRGQAGASAGAGNITFTMPSYTPAKIKTWRMDQTGNFAFPGGYIGDGFANNGLDLVSANGGFVALTAPSSNGEVILGQVFVDGEDNNLNAVNIMTSDPSGAPNYNWSYQTNGAIYFPTTSSSQRTGSGDNLKFAKTAQQKIISTQNGTDTQNTVERLVITGGDSYLDSGNGVYIGEGGDLYMWAGKGENGGDIKVDAGQSLGLNNQGGTVKIRGGNSGDGYGGFVEIDGGTGSNGSGGPIQLTGGYGSSDGGIVTLTGGQGGVNGGTVTITGGVGGAGLTNYGNVSIASGASSWTFDNQGYLTLASSGTPTLTGDANYFSLRTVRNGYDGIESSSNSITKIDNQANVAIISDSANTGNTKIWTFDSDGTLTMPSSIHAYAYLQSTENTPINIQTTGANIAQIQLANTGIILYSNDGHSNITLDNAGNVSMSGNLTVTGKIYNNPTYGQFWSNATQGTGSANSEVLFTFNNTDGVSNVALGTGASNSQVIINKTGKYNIQFSAQIDKTGGSGLGSAVLWFKKNGTAIPSSAGFFTLDNSVQAVQSWNLIFDAANVGDYVEIAYSITNTNISFPAIAGNATVGYPDIPSIILTVTPVGP